MDEVKYGDAAQPNSPEALNNLAALERTSGRVAAAESLLRRALALRQGDPTLLNNLALAVRDLGRMDEAASLFRASLAANPRYAEAAHNLAGVLLVQEHAREAEAFYRRASELDSGFLPARLGLAESLAAQGRFDAALAAYDHILAARPDLAVARAGRARVLEKRGDYERAWEDLRPALANATPDPEVVLAMATLGRRLNRQAEAVSLATRTLAHPQLSATHRQKLLFMLGDLLDDSGDYDAAFARYRDANGLSASGQPARADQVQFEMIRAAFDAETLKTLPRARVATDRPVFIVGMPRSGTSLVEQILASHPAVHGGGELPWLGDLCNAFPRFLGEGRLYPAAVKRLTREEMDMLANDYIGRLGALAPNALRVTDKMPHNFLHLGLVELILPRARVIHCRRDPRDTCISVYFHNFNAKHPYASDLGRLGRYYREYAALMRYWRETLKLPILDIQYESLVEDLEGTTRQMLDFCGLEWNPGCLRFHESGRTVNTPSYDQVRRPLYKGSVGRWKQYATHIGPLLASLDGGGA